MFILEVPVFSDFLYIQSFNLIIKKVNLNLNEIIVVLFCDSG